MLPTLVTVIVVLGALVTVMAGVYAALNRLIDDWLLGVLALMWVALVAQVVISLVHLGDLAQEKATFTAYALCLPFIPLITAYMAIREKTRWSMGAVAIGAFSVAVMVWRMHQIWGLYA